MVTLFTLIFIYGHEKPPNLDFLGSLIERKFRVVSNIETAILSSYP